MANYIATDTDLGAVADAIRTKGGTSAQLEFPQGFVDAISAISGGGGVLGVTQDEDGYLVLSPLSGGAGYQSGSFVLASASRTFTVPLDGAISNFLFYIESFPEHPLDGSGWLTVSGFWRSATSFFTLQRYSGGQTNQIFTSTATVTSTEISCTVANYNVPAGVNVYWIGW